MIIKLKEIKVIYISPNHNEKYNKRKIHMDHILTKLGFTNIIHYKSSTENYPYCLNKASIDIFSNYQLPYLLLEDDIESNFDYIPNELILPDNADAFYLGLSTGGGHVISNYDDGNSKFIYLNDSLLKVKNMLSAHAVLYITNKYTNRLKDELIRKSNYYNDVLFSQNQSLFNIYCNRYCYFYQAKEYDGHEKATRFIIDPINIDNYPQTNKTVTFVTAFINISSTINKQDYFNDFEKLASTGIPIVLFMDSLEKEYGTKLTNTYSNVKIIRYMSKDELHVNKLSLPSKLPEDRNKEKDTEDFLKLMNNKIFFVEEASKVNVFNTVVYAWIDFRIFHIITDNELITKKLQDISVKKYDSNIIEFAGNWQNKNLELNKINWRFLGGYFLIGNNNIDNLIQKTKNILLILSTLTWEVNIWAILECVNNFNFGWYLGDHNNYIFK